MREYFLSVICCAILCSIIRAVTDKKSTSGKLLKLISGVVLTFTVLAPVAEVKLEEISFYLSDLSAEGEAVASMGRAHAVDAMEAIIKQETEAYILDKANALHIELEVHVCLDEDMKPSAVNLTGKIPESERKQLAHIIARDLGIAKEDQHWKVS